MRKPDIIKRGFIISYQTYKNGKRLHYIHGNIFLSRVGGTEPTVLVCDYRGNDKYYYSQIISGVSPGNLKCKKDLATLPLIYKF